MGALDLAPLSSTDVGGGGDELCGNERLLRGNNGGNGLGEGAMGHASRSAVEEAHRMCECVGEGAMWWSERKIEVGVSMRTHK